MYIEFELPSGAGGMAAGHALSIIRKEVADWAAQYEIKFTTKVHKYTMRLCLEDDAKYTFFQLSWSPKGHYAFRYKLIKTEQ